jgi:Helicase HerA-like C-terminal
VARGPPGWYARLVTTLPILGDRIAGPWVRVESIAPVHAQPTADRDFLAMLPAAAAAAQQRRPLVTGWLSTGAGASLQLITNAVVPASGGGTELLFPPAARGTAAGDWLACAGELVWTACPGRQAPPLISVRPETPLADAGPPAGFESALAALLGRPFGWLVVAVPTDLLEPEVAELRAESTVLRQHDTERARFGAERAQRRLAELDSFAEAGLWEVRVLVGAASPAELALIAPVLAGSADLGNHPYRLSASPAGAGRLAEALTAKHDDPASGARVPFPATAGVLAALAGLPRHEVPGLRVLGPAQFDLTSEAGGGEEEPSVSLGGVLDGQDRPVGEFRLPLATVNRHAFVTGATGAGKSQTVRHLLEQLTGAGVPWLVIEPVKSEYAGMVGRLAGAGAVTVISPADPGAVPLSVNPLEPEAGYPVQAHIDMLRALFLAAFDADEPFPQIMAQALQRVYEACGWDVVTGDGLPGAQAPPAVPSLAGLQTAALGVIGSVGYGRELQADVRGFVDVRLRSLRIGSAGRFFEGGHPADIGGLLRRNVVLTIEDVANDEDKAFLMGTLIIRIVEHLRLRARAEGGGGLRHVIVIEEAHRLLRARHEGRASAHAVELFASLLAEIRAYGEGLVIADQIPAKLIPDVVKNTALKVVHRLPAADDRQQVGAAMNLGDDQSRQVVSLPPGVAAVFADGMDRPVRLRVPFGGARERVGEGPPPPLRGRRSPACGPCCAEHACTLAEIRHADVLAAPASPRDAWLRVWGETLVLAFVTGRGMPGVPSPLRQRWQELPTRLGECMLATVIDRAVAARASALRACYDPARLVASASTVALRLLGDGRGAGTRAGPSWVIPQVRWLHELERACPPGQPAPDLAAATPPLDYDLPGIADWPGMRVGHRLRALARHHLSMALPHNAEPAWNALLGDDDQRDFGRDLATIAVGLPPAAHVDHVARLMGARTWLETVLSWPRRFVAGDEQWGTIPAMDEPNRQGG